MPPSGIEQSPSSLLDGTRAVVFERCFMSTRRHLERECELHHRVSIAARVERYANRAPPATVVDCCESKSGLLRSTGSEQRQACRRAASARSARRMPRRQ